MIIIIINNPVNFFGKRQVACGSFEFIVEVKVKRTNTSDNLCEFKLMKLTMGVLLLLFTLPSLMGKNYLKFEEEEEANNF